MSSNRAILLGGNPRRSRRTAGGTITPGDLIAPSGSSVIRNTGLFGVNRMVAAEQPYVGKDIDDDYASGDGVDVLECGPGDLVNGLVAAGAAAIVAGDRLEQGTTSGKVRKSVRASATVAGQSAANGDLTFTAREGFQGAAGNGLRIVVPDAGTAGVTVVGTTITVTPGSGANTAAAVKAQIEANAAANQMVAVTHTGGDGAGGGEPGITTGVNLSGAIGYGDVAVADESVDNSGGSSVARIAMRIL